MLKVLGAAFALTIVALAAVAQPAVTMVTTDHTAAPADCGKEIHLMAHPPAPDPRLTLGQASTYPRGCKITIKNTDARAQIVILVPGLGPSPLFQQSSVVYCRTSQPEAWSISANGAC